MKIRLFHCGHEELSETHFPGLQEFYTQSEISQSFYNYFKQHSDF